MEGSIYEKKDLTFFWPQGRGGSYLNPRFEEFCRTTLIFQTKQSIPPQIPPHNHENADPHCSCKQTQLHPFSKYQVIQIIRCSDRSNPRLEHWLQEFYWLYTHKTFASITFCKESTNGEATLTFMTKCDHFSLFL